MHRVVASVNAVALAAAAAVVGGIPAAGAAVAPTHSNGQIAYNCGGNGVALVAASGSNRVVHRTTTDVGAPNGLAWTADGSQLAVAAEQSGSLPSAITLTEPDLTWPLRITQGFGGFGLYGGFDRPAWDATGHWLAFTAQNGAERSRVMVTRADGLAPPLLLPQPDGFNDHPDVAPDESIVFDNATTVSSVYRLDPGATDALEILTDASQPRFSPDGQRIAFLRGGQVWVAARDGSAATQVTTVDRPRPVVAFDWSPDGASFVIVRASSSVWVVSSSGGAERKVSGAECTFIYSVGWQPVPATSKDWVVRLGGSDRVATAIATSRWHVPDDSAGAVVLSRSDGFADALSGTPLAVAKRGPLLLTPPTSLDDRVRAEIDRVLPAGGQVYLLGGTGALSAAVAGQVEAAGYRVTRLSGANRFATSVDVARHLGADAGAAGMLFLATGLDFPDALSAGAAAGSYWDGAPDIGGAVLLTNGTSVTSDVADFLAQARSSNPDVFVTAVGGAASAAALTVLADPDVLRLVGADRYDTAAYVAEAHFGPADGVGVATGTGFADALAGGVLAARRNYPLLLTRPAGLPGGEASGYLHWFSGSLREGVVFGGTGGVSAAAEAQLRAVIGVGTISVSLGLGFGTGSTGAAPAVADRSVEWPTPWGGSKTPPTAVDRVAG